MIGAREVSGVSGVDGVDGVGGVSGVCSVKNAGISRILKFRRVYAEFDMFI